MRKFASHLALAAAWSTIVFGGGCLVFAVWSLTATGRQTPMGNDAFQRSQSAIKATADFSRASVAVAEPDDERPGSPAKLFLGDRVRITIYERLEGFGPPSEGAKRTVGLVEQSMISGDYVVEQSGHVVLPILGAIEAAELTMGELDRKVREAYAAVFRQNARVSVLVTDRRPIYVLGAGGKSGTFKFSPELTVLHVLALASTDERRDVYLQSELVRQGERNAMSLRKLEKSLARAIVLRAERDGGTAKPTAGLMRIAGAEKSRVLLEADLAMRKLTGQLNQSQIDAARGTIATSLREIAEIKQKAAILDENIKVRRQRKDALSTLTDSMSARHFLKNQVAAEVYEVEERRQEAVLSLSQAQRRLEEGERALARLLTNQKLELEKEITATEQDVAEQETAVAGSERLIQELRMQDLQARLAEQTPTFEIVRQTSNGPQRLQADQMTALKPGDLVQVRATKPP